MGLTYASIGLTNLFNKQKVEFNALVDTGATFMCVTEEIAVQLGFDMIHDLRHTHASIAINNGASLYEVQHLLGHSQAKTTTRYAHLADETLRRVSEAVSRAIV